MVKNRSKQVYKGNPKTVVINTFRTGGKESIRTRSIGTGQKHSKTDGENAL